MGQDPRYDNPELHHSVTPKEQELLVRLMEEAGEIVQAAAKVLRWGWYSAHPDGGLSNLEALTTECDDLTFLVGRLYLVYGERD